MELKQMHALVAIADHGSFSAAARALATVQSNVSAHIARLESELGVSLVERHGGTLTTEGELVAARARRVIHEMEDIASDIHSLGSFAVGESRLGTIGTTARWLMPRLLSTLDRTHPGVRMTVTESASTSLIALLGSGAIDAAILHLPVSGDGLEVHELFVEDLIIVCGNTHPLAGRSSVSVADLAAHPLLLAPKGTAQRRLIDAAAASHGVTLRAQAEIDGVRLMTSLAFEGFGAAIVPASAVPAWLTGPFTRVTVVGLPTRTVGWVQRTRPRPNRATIAVRDTTAEIVRRHGEKQQGVRLPAT